MANKKLLNGTKMTAFESKRTALSAKTNITNKLANDAAKLTLDSNTDDLKAKIQKVNVLFYFNFPLYSCFVL